MGKLVAEKEERIFRLRTEYESRIQAMDARHGRELDQERVKLQSLLRDSEHFVEVMLDPLLNHEACSAQSLRALAEGHAQMLQALQLRQRTVGLTLRLSSDARPSLLPASATSPAPYQVPSAMCGGLPASLGASPGEPV